MTFKKLSAKQKRIFRWPYSDDYSAIICDGAVRSGKTICMITSFILWAMRRFNGATFGICGKTVRSAERNIIMPLQSIVDVTAYFKLTYTRSINLLTVEGNGRKNYFYVFGGKDESSYMLIQGITLSGVLFDEIVLMPQSFVEQAITRTLSVQGAKLWFNCNPDTKYHWFYREWILNTEMHDALHLHFLMQDNPILTPEMIATAERQFTGVFHDRYIRGLWVAAEGLIYPQQAAGANVVATTQRDYTAYYVSMDYGTLNPCSMGLWGHCGGVWYRVREYYHSGRDTQKQLTDDEYYSKLLTLCDGLKIKAVVVDPSAASFITLVKRHGQFNVIPAKNDVVSGIRFTAECFSTNRIMINDCCTATIDEFSAYAWDDKSNYDRPLKQHDHAMDDIRYFCYTVLSQGKARTIDRYKLGLG